MKKINKLYVLVEAYRQVYLYLTGIYICSGENKESINLITFVMKQLV